MSSAFFSITPSGQEIRHPLEGRYACPFQSPVWLIGAGPSLKHEDIEAINASPAPKFCVNLSGRGRDGLNPLVRPNFWTAYDTTSRFHRSIYLDPGIAKFVSSARKYDIVPDSPYKVFQCPNTFFFEREHREYHDFLDIHSSNVLDCQDSMIQAIDIIYRLGFRKVFMVGVELGIFPSEAQIDKASEYGVEWDMRTLSTKMEKGRDPLLRGFDARCKQMGMIRHCEEGEDCAEDGTKRTILDVSRPNNYSMDEIRPWQTTLTSDEHYYRTSQYLRMAITNLYANGLDLNCCTYPSRIADYFPVVTVEEACEWIKDHVGDPRQEITSGAYNDPPKPGSNLMPMRDYKPHGFDPEKVVGLPDKKTENDRLDALVAKMASMEDDIALDDML